MEVTRIALKDIDDNSKKEKVYIDNSVAKIYNFDSAEKVDNVVPLGNSAVKYSKKEKALNVKVSGSGNLSTPASFRIGGKYEVDSEMFNGTLPVNKYPVLAMRVKKANFDSMDMGTMYWSTTDSINNSREWVQFKSPKFAFDGEWQTIVVDLSFEMSYYDSAIASNLPLFTGNWKGLQIGFPKTGTAKLDSEFFVKWIGFFPSVKEALEFELNKP